MTDDTKQVESQDVVPAPDTLDGQLPDAQPIDRIIEHGGEQLFTEESVSNAASVVVNEDEYLKAYRAKADSETIWFPLLGNHVAAKHRTILLSLLLLFFTLTALFGVYIVRLGNFVREQSSAISTLQISSIRLSQSLDESIIGKESAFSVLDFSYQKFKESLSALGGKPIAWQKDLSSSVLASDIQGINDSLEDTLDKDIKLILGRKQTLVQLSAYVASMKEQVLAIQAQLNKLNLALIKRRASAGQVAAVGKISSLVERIEKNSRDFLTSGGVRLKDGQNINADLAMAKNLLTALAEGGSSYAIAPLMVGEMPTLDIIQQAFTRLYNNASSVVNLAPEVRQAYARLANSLNEIKPIIAQLDDTLNKAEVVPTWLYIALVICAFLTLSASGGLAYVQMTDTQRLQDSAELENKKNQMAIFRLVDELEQLSKGDLTQEASVNNDITDIIADSINATVEDWRDLIGNVQTTVDRVVRTTADVELTSSTLLEIATEQLAEIRNTGTSVLDMASRIYNVSGQAKESASVAQRSREAAEQGFKAVQNSIASMNTLRGQIQETAKRIKCLGESSQEIGEITELISDITEQTNVLALNAAIQAASAGEAGRGFSVVAEEVQRLAERSAEATKQIAALVKTIQTDAHDAVAAMERSTQGVIQGAKLSDDAGQALEQINQVSRQLAELIQKISITTDQQAQQANVVADNIQEIFSVTGQTTEGTKTTAKEVRELAKVAQELRDSVSRFKIG